jgi:hypothetical protein
MTMSKRNQTLKRVGPFAAGVLIGLSVVTPVFAATLDVEAVQPFLLLGSLVVLLVGLILKALSERPSTPANAQDSHTLAPGDLRWHQTDLATDIAMPHHSMR